MAREMTDQEHEDLADTLMEHMDQVDAGLIPPDSPPTFLKPEGQDALVNGLPWWFGPDYDGNAAQKMLPESQEPPK